jgi:hypothetical protein
MHFKVKKKLIRKRYFEANLFFPKINRLSAEIVEIEKRRRVEGNGN